MKTIIEQKTCGEYYIQNWKQWCRLCAKEDPHANIDVFIKDEQSPELTLIAAIEKYFLISINQGDEFPNMLCTECFSLVTSLGNFSERVAKAQAMFGALQRSNTTDVIELHQLRLQFGLLDEDRQHIIPHPSTEIHYFEEKPKIMLLRREEAEKNDPVAGVVDQDEEMEDVEYIEDEKPFAPLRIKKEFQTEDLKDIVKQMHIPIDDDDKCWNNEEQPINDIGGDTENKSFLYAANHCSNENTIESPYDKEDEGNTITQHKRRTLRSTTPNRSRCKPSKKVKIELSDDEEFHDDGGDSDCPTTPPKKEKKKSKFVHCTQCPKKFKINSHLRKHMSKAHNITVEAPDLACGQCKKVFSTERQFDAHQKSHLPLDKKKSYSCPYCDKKFTKTLILENHISGVHMNEKPFICEECGRTMRTFAGLKEHKLTHTEDRPFECEVCQKKFKNKARLKIHADIHTNTNYICTECGLQLNTRRTLKMHMLVHSDQKRHKCDYCGTEFKRAKALKNHLILHTGLKPYTCNFCDKTFANGSNCRSHKKKSHPEELAAMEAAGAKTMATNIPKLEQLRAVTKASENLAPVISKQSGSLTAAALMASIPSTEEGMQSFMQQQAADVGLDLVASNIVGSNDINIMARSKIDGSPVGDDSHSSFADAASTKSQIDVVNSLQEQQQQPQPMPLHLQLQQQAEQFANSIFDTLPIESKVFV